MERKLIEQGLLTPVGDNQWRVKTRETAGEGELAASGDYIKLDSIGMPYPNKKAWFEANHTMVGENLYLQKVQPRKAWHAMELLCPEIRFLLDRDMLWWSRKEGFRAVLWDTVQTAAPDAVLILDQVERDAEGCIQKVDFHFVAAEEFERTYEVLP